MHTQFSRWKLAQFCNDTGCKSQQFFHIIILTVFPHIHSKKLDYLNFESMIYLNSNKMMKGTHI